MAFEQESVGQPAGKQGMSPFAKIAIGCVVALVLLCIASFAVITIFGLKAAKWVEEMEVSLNEIQAEPGTEVARIFSEAEAASPFEEPETPATTAERVDAFYRVREKALPKAQVIEDFFVRMEQVDGQGAQAQMSDVKRIFTIWGEWADARKGFGEALKEEGMSPAEYEYLVRLLYLSDLVEVQMPEGAGDLELPLEGIPDVPDETAEFVRGLADRIQAAPPTLADAVILGWGSEDFAAQSGIGGGTRPAPVETYEEPVDEAVPVEEGGE